MTHIDKINDLQILQKLETINGLFDELANQENFPDFVLLCQRIKTIANFLAQVFKGNNLDFIPLQTAVSINTNLKQLPDYLTKYKDSKNLSYLETANNILDAVLILVPQLLFPYSGIDSKFFDAGIDSFLEKTKDFNSYITSTKEKYNADIDEANKKLSNTQKEIEKANAVIEQQKTRLDASIQTTQTSFLDEQKKRDKEFSKSLSEFKDAEQKLNCEIKERADNTHKDIETKIAEIFTDLENKKKQAADLVGIVSNIAVTGNFNKYAEEQKKNANRTRIGAIVCFGIILGFSCWIIFGIKSQNFEFGFIFIKMLSTAILTLPATYLARESSKHRSREMYYRKMELELASLDPLMASLSPDEQNALKQEIIKRMFGREEEIKIVKKGISYTGKNLTDFFEPLVQSLIKFLEKKNG